MKYVLAIFSFCILLSQNNELPDDRLQWLLTNPENIEKLDENKSKIISTEITKMVEKFNNEVVEKGLFKPSQDEKIVSTSSSFDKDEYDRLLKELGDETLASFYATKTYAKTKKVTYNKGFTLPTTILSSQTPEWSEIVEYYGGYSELVSIGIKKSDLELFKITRFLKRIELLDDKRCVAIIKISGEKDYGLKFYNIKKTQELILGTHQISNFTITDIYFISKEDKESTKIEFSFTDKELVDLKYDVFLKSVIDINDQIVDLSKPYLGSIAMMIDDIVPISYYNTLDHRKKLIDDINETANQKHRAEQREKNKEKIIDQHFAILTVFLYEELTRRQLFIDYEGKGMVDKSERISWRTILPIDDFKDNWTTFYGYYFKSLKKKNNVKMKRKAKGNIPKKPTWETWWKESYYLSKAWAILWDLNCPYWSWNLTSEQRRMLPRCSNWEPNEIMGIRMEFNYNILARTKERKVKDVYEILNRVNNIDFYWLLVRDYLAQNFNINSLDNTAIPNAMEHYTKTSLRKYHIIPPFARDFNSARTTFSTFHKAYIDREPLDKWLMLTK